MRPISRHCLSFALVGFSSMACSSGGAPINSSGGGGTGGNTGTGGTTGGGGTGGSASGTGGNSGTAGSGATGGSTGTGGMGAGCTPAPLDTSGTLAGPFESVKTTSGGHEYFLQVNKWNMGANVTTLGAQTMDFGGPFAIKMTTQTAVATTAGGPTGFPSIFIGANSNHMTMNSNLPKAVSALTTVPTTWNWNDAGTLADTTANSYNATYDVWFNTTSAINRTAFPTGGFLMVWLYDPPDAQPIGARRYTAVTIPGVSGTWDVWVGLNGADPCISYLRTEHTLSLSFDLNAFIQDAVTNRTQANGMPTIQSTWFLSNIFTGFEIWRGGVNLETTSFCAIVN
jgi:hypothetical protein